MNNKSENLREYKSPGTTEEFNCHILSYVALDTFKQHSDTYDISHARDAKEDSLKVPSFEAK